MTAKSVTVCSWGEANGVSVETQEALTLARRVSAALGEELRWVVVGLAGGDVATVAASYGVAALDRVADPKLAEFQGDTYVEAIGQYCAQRQPKVLMLSQTFDGRLVAPRLAGRLKVGIVMNGVAVEAVGDTLQVTASAYGGDTRAVYEFCGQPPFIVSVAANACVPEPADAGTTAAESAVAVELAAITERVAVIEQASSDDPRLEDAQTIVAGGRGLGEADNFKLIVELAEALGGMAAASRPIVDDGWAERFRQVGLTGKITKPALYIAAGISGASQHMVGCSAAKTLVAINKDPDAAIFKHARYGIVADCLEILPEITRAVKGE